MSDREPGVFYIIHSSTVETFNPWGEHYKRCIEYYRDYGEILEAVFCHDLTRDYEYEEVICNNSTYLEPTTEVHFNSVQLQWSNSAGSEFIRGYHVYRDNVRITNQLLTTASYLDENLLAGDYEYFIRTFYMEGCISDSSNRVMATIDVGVKETIDLESIMVYPNPTTGELRIKSVEYRVESIDIFDVYGRLLNSTIYNLNSTINISHLQAGVYFVKITAEKGVVMRKIVKQ